MTTQRKVLGRLVPACFCLLWTPVVAAQVVAPGQRVRVTTTTSTPRVIVGELLRLDEDSLVLQSDGGRLSVPPGAVSVEKFAGRHGHTLAGAGIGALLVGGFIAVDYQRKPGQCRGSGNYGQLCAMFLVLGTLAGAGVGALVGTAIRHDEWISVSLEPGADVLARPPLQAVAPQGWRLGTTSAVFDQGGPGMPRFSVAFGVPFG